MTLRSIPGLPVNGLILIKDQAIIKELQNQATVFLTDCKISDWTFTLWLSERWYQNADKFRVFFYGGSRGSYPISTTEKSTPLQIEDVKYLRCSPRDYCRGNVSLEYRTSSGQWYGNPLIDCLEGWIRAPDSRVFFKIGCSWYQVEAGHVSWVDQILSKMLGISGLVLRYGEMGNLYLTWNAGVDETNYNRLYLQQNPQVPFRWFDGNQKLFLRFELFDILQVIGNDVYIYHVKQKFGTSAKEAGAQLLSSAHVIQSCRHKSIDHPDRLKFTEYCMRVGKSHAEGKYLEEALLKGKLHFVLAFQFGNDPLAEIMTSGSISAKHEMIKARENIETINSEFSFHISPILYQAK